MDTSPLERFSETISSLLSNSQNTKIDLGGKEWQPEGKDRKT